MSLNLFYCKFFTKYFLIFNMWKILSQKNLISLSFSHCHCSDLYCQMLVFDHRQINNDLISLFYMDYLKHIVILILKINRSVTLLAYMKKNH